MKSLRDEFKSVASIHQAGDGNKVKQPRIAHPGHILVYWPIFSLCLLDWKSCWLVLALANDRLIKMSMVKVAATNGRYRCTVKNRLTAIPIGFTNTKFGDVASHVIYGYADLSC